ncbi:hypothetical protein, partial [Acinetobacter baumannii]|uniref:hypothetical protein n=1 Tax=Acinetobacter baumannii TaxID=470 RepID=UPI00196A0415
YRTGITTTKVPLPKSNQAFGTAPLHFQYRKLVAFLSFDTILSFGLVRLYCFTPKDKTNLP